MLTLALCSLTQDSLIKTKGEMMNYLNKSEMQKRSGKLFPHYIDNMIDAINKLIDEVEDLKSKRG